MNFVYILKSLKNQSYYIGSTGDLDRRLIEHNFGKTKSLVNLLPMELVFKQNFDTLLEARRAELKLKNFKSRRIIEQIILDGKIKSI
jgi:putative endonuclease